MKTAIFLFIALLPISLCAQTSDCPDSTFLKELKDAIDHKKRSNVTSGSTWVHQNLIMKAACADETEDKIKQRQRIQFMWQAFGNIAVSKDTNLVLKDLLKYAILKPYGPLILEAANRWKLDMSQFDKDMQHSLLDVIEMEISYTEDDKRKAMLEEYSKVIVNAGALPRNHVAFISSLIQKHYDGIGIHAYGLYPVRKNNKWGLVNHRNEVVIPLEYSHIRRFTDELFEVSNDNISYFFIDKYNKVTKGPWD